MYGIWVGNLEREMIQLTKPLEQKSDSRLKNKRYATWPTFIELSVDFFVSSFGWKESSKSG